MEQCLTTEKRSAEEHDSLTLRCVLCVQHVVLFCVLVSVRVDMRCWPSKHRAERFKRQR